MTTNTTKVISYFDEFKHKFGVHFKDSPSELELVEGFLDEVYREGKEQCYLEIGDLITKTRETGRKEERIKIIEVIQNSLDLGAMAAANELAEMHCSGWENCKSHILKKIDKLD